MRDPEPTPAALELELLPGRPEDPGRYTTPVARGVATALGGGEWLVAASAGEPVVAAQLEAQIGAARRATVLGASPLLLTLHRVQLNNRQRSYLMVYSGVDLDPSARGQPSSWSELAPGVPIARVSGSSSPVGLRFSIRQLRQGVDPERVAPERLLRDSHSVPCDPRNVLPLRP